METTNFSFNYMIVDMKYMSRITVEASPIATLKEVRPQLMNALNTKMLEFFNDFKLIPIEWKRNTIFRYRDSIAEKSFLCSTFVSEGGYIFIEIRKGTLAAAFKTQN